MQVDLRGRLDCGMHRLPPLPPFIPNTGPSDGSREVIITCFPMRASPCVSPMEVTVLPSPLSRRRGGCDKDQLATPRECAVVQQSQADLSAIRANLFEIFSGSSSFLTISRIGRRDLAMFLFACHSRGLAPQSTFRGMPKATGGSLSPNNATRATRSAFLEYHPAMATNSPFAGYAAR